MRNENMEIIKNAPVTTYRARVDGLIVLIDTFTTLTRTEIAKSETSYEIDDSRVSHASVSSSSSSSLSFSMDSASR